MGDQYLHVRRAAPTGRLVRVRAVVAYDGSAFRGFAHNEGVVSVKGTLVDAIGRVLRHDVDITGAGRTDAGVHAWGQVITFDAEADRFDPVRLQKSVNALCGPTVVLRSVEAAPVGFDARFSARWRRYRYTVLNRAVPDPFLAPTSWHVVKPLDLTRLRLACDPLLGEHDFSAFCRKPRPAPGMPMPSLSRRVTHASWSDLGDGVLQFEIRANAFCHNQVRSIVGTLVEIGWGRGTPADVGRLLRSRERTGSGNVAPPHGLCLWQVGYDGWTS
jgi:tRNA pseudouridine38-40 synthase